MATVFFCVKKNMLLPSIHLHGDTSVAAVFRNELVLVDAPFTEVGDFSEAAHSGDREGCVVG